MSDVCLTDDIDIATIDRKNKWRDKQQCPFAGAYLE